MIICYECGKEIKSKTYILKVPANFYKKFYGEFDKAYHSGCYKKAEKKAENKLTKREVEK